MNTYNIWTGTDSQIDPDNGDYHGLYDADNEIQAIRRMLSVWEDKSNFDPALAVIKHQDFIPIFGEYEDSSIEIYSVVMIQLKVDKGIESICKIVDAEHCYCCIQFVGNRRIPPDETKPEQIETDPPDINPEEKTITISHGQNGVTYKSLFFRYLRGAKFVKICDPYIINPYQMSNFTSFCTILVDANDEPIQLHLITGYYAYNESDIKKYLNNLKQELKSEHNIDLKWELKEMNNDNGLHDRWIETDTGWIITLGRGLDIFQFTSKFSIASVDQEKRKCKETKITYNKKNK